MSQPTVQALIQQLQSSDPAVRFQAALALIDMADPAACDALIMALSDSDAEVRRAAVRALSALDDVRAHAAIAAALRDRESRVRRRVVSWLIKHPTSPAVVEPLLAILSDPQADPAARDYAAMTLAQGDHRQGIPIMNALLPSVPVPLQRRLTHSLMLYADESSVPALAAQLNNADTPTRKAAAKALRRIGTAAALDALREHPQSDEDAAP